MKLNLLHEIAFTTRNCIYYMKLHLLQEMACPSMQAACGKCFGEPVPLPSIADAASSAARNSAKSVPSMHPVCDYCGACMK